MVEVAHFQIDYTQILNPEGKLVQALPEFAKDTANLVHLYRTMTLLRTFDTKAIALQRTGKLGTYPSTLGQEAVSVGLGHAMKPEDVMCPAYREYGAQMQRNIDLADILLYWGGDERGSAFKNNSDDFPMSVPIGSQCLHAAGVAVAFKYRKQPRVAVSICGDGATSQGDFYEAMNVAGAWNLPVVFLVSNNQWAISIPRELQTKCQTLAQKAIAAGIPGEQVDGNDVIAVREVLSRALERARSGQGPSVVEALTYRLCDHTTADDASRYRGKEELENAWKIEPLLRLRKYLMDQNAWSEQDEQKLTVACAAEVDTIVQRYQAVGQPAIADMFQYHYAKMPAGLKEQQAIAEIFITEKHHHG